MLHRAGQLRGQTPRRRGLRQRTSHHKTHDRQPITPGSMTSLPDGRPKAGETTGPAAGARCPRRLSGAGGGRGPRRASFPCSRSELPGPRTGTAPALRRRPGDRAVPVGVQRSRNRRRVIDPAVPVDIDMIARHPAEEEMHRQPPRSHTCAPSRPAIATTAAIIASWRSARSASIAGEYPAPRPMPTPEADRLFPARRPAARSPHTDTAATCGAGYCATCRCAASGERHRRARTGHRLPSAAGAFSGSRIQPRPSGPPVEHGLRDEASSRLPAGRLTKLVCPGRPLPDTAKGHSGSRVPLLKWR
jgi:hypothetical protein